jgi:dienelactone hydrolase
VKRAAASLLLLAAGAAQAAEPVRVATPRGAAIEILQETPAGNGPFPAVILGAGQGGDLRTDVLAQTARAFVAGGFAVFRFNWAYVVRGEKAGAQSADRVAEIEDFETVLAAARSTARVDRDRILVAGKSLGSIIAWRVLQRDPTLRGAVLLTPVCGKENVPIDTLYPQIAAETRPSVWIAGDRDPACNIATLYGFAGRSTAKLRVDIVDGDHSYAPAGTDSAATTRRDATQALAAQLALRFATDTLGAVPTERTSSSN